MPDPITPQIVPPQDSEGSNLGGTWGTPSRPWSAGFFHALFVRGKAVATVDSPRLVGAPQAQSPESADDSDRIATTAWVRDLVGAVQIGASNLTGLGAGVLAWLLDPTSAKLRTAVTDETGTGSLVFATSPTLVTPTLGAATALTVNGLTIDTTTGTLDLVNGSTLATAGANSITLTSTGTTNVTLPTSGTLGTLNNDTKLANGTSDEVTAAAIRAHLDSTALHRQIDDASTASTTTWSSTKIAAELADVDTAINQISVPPTTSEIINTIGAALQSGGGISWSLATGVSITPSTTGLLKADGSVAGTGRQELLRLNFTDATTLTINAGSVTSTRTLHTIAAETGTADDLVTINTAENGDVLILRADSGDTITLKHNTGNILCAGATDLAVSGNTLAFLLKDSDGWIAGLFGSASSGDALTSGTLAQFAATTSAQLAGVISDETGTGGLVFANTPTLVTPVLGTPTSGTLTNCTGLPIATGVSGLGTGVGTFLATPSSANLRTAVTDETGTGALVFAESPTLVTPALGTPASGNLSNCTAIPGGQITAQREVLIIAASDESTNLTTGTAKVTFRMPFAMTLTGIRGSLSTAQGSGSVLTVDVNEGGSSILSTKLTFDNTEKTTTTATTPAVISDTALADDAEITVDIDQVGTAGARGLKITLIGTRA